MPASQIEHWLAPLAENCPAVQSVQFSASASEYVPPSHVSHDAAAASDFLPESQIVHEAAPLLEKRPAVQSIQLDAVSFDHVPLSHLEHALLPAVA